MRVPSRRVQGPGPRPAAGVAWIAALLLSLMAGCATAPREWVVVMPSQDGHAGTVVVTRDGVETMLHGAYSAWRSDTAGPFLADPQSLATFAAALQATPPRPVVYTVHFAADLDELTGEQRAQFERIAREIAQRPSPQVTVVGHADTTLSHQHNDALSLRRAQRIRAELIRLGVPAESITAEGRGKREPLVPTPDNQAEPRNRRVEVEVR